VLVRFDLVVDKAVVEVADVVEVEVEDFVVLATDFELVEVVEVELVVLGAAELDEDAAALVAGGGITLKLTVAPHSARVNPSSQHPASVQYVPAVQ
jgi:hypothetical protein